MKPINKIGLYLLFALVILSALPVWVYVSDPFEEFKIINILVYVACSGGIGGTIYSARGFYSNLGGKTFEANWTWWYILRPVLSAIIGVFMYFLIVGGLLSITNSPDVNYSKSVMFYCALAFLAGFSFTQFMSKVEQLSNTIFSTNSEDNGNNDNGDNEDEDETVDTDPENKGNKKNKTDKKDKKDKKE